MATKRNLDELFSIAQTLRAMNLQVESAQTIRNELTAFVLGYKVMCRGRSKEQLWFRARKCENGERFSCLSELVYRPQPGKDYGRSHMPGASVLYASRNPGTAVSEIRATDGDIIQTIALRPIDGADIPCYIVGEFQSFAQSGRCLVGGPPFEAEIGELLRQDPNRFRCCLLVDSVMTEFFRKPVDDDKDYEYKICALWSELMHISNVGMLYPSVQMFLSQNIAVPAPIFDRFFEVVYAEVSRVVRDYGYGIQRTESLHRASVFENDGRIRWDLPARFPFSHNQIEGFRETEPVRGWRKCEVVPW